jgi:hypothetical protein
MTIGTHKAKSGGFAAAKPGVEGAGRVDKQVSGRLLGGDIPRGHEGLDVRSKATGDLTRHFEPFASIGAIRVPDQHQ